MKHSFVSADVMLALSVVVFSLWSQPAAPFHRADQPPPRGKRLPPDNSPSSFHDNHDGTVTGPATGLVWQQTDGGEMTWENAQSYCTSLSLGGNHDWRLPSTYELFRIMEQDRPKPALDTRAFHSTGADYWWTSETRADDPSRVWVINDGGGAGPHPKRETLSAGGDRRFHARCVRGLMTPAATWSDNGDGTITDRRSGLVWQQGEAPGAMTWDDAQQYAKNLRIGEHTDWRLPTIKELQSISDPKLVRPSISQVFFPGAAGEEYWSSTAMGNRPNYAWTVNFAVGIVSYSERTKALRVRAAHGPIENGK